MCALSVERRHPAEHGHTSIWRPSLFSLCGRPLPSHTDRCERVNLSSSVPVTAPPTLLDPTSDAHQPRTLSTFLEPDMNHQYPARSQAQQPSECYSGTSAAYDTSSMVPALAQPVPYSTFTSAEPPAWVDPAHLDNTATPPSAQLAFYLTDSPQSSNSSPHPSYWPDHKYGFVFNSARPDLHPGFRHDVVNPRDLISTGASEQHRYLESRPSTYSSAGPPLHYGYYPEEPSHLQGPSPYTLDGHHPLYSPYPQSTLASQPLQQPQPQAAWPLTKVLESSREAPRLSTPQPPEKAKSSRSSSTMEESPVKLEAGPLEAAPNSPSTADSAKDSASPSGAARDPEDAALETSVCTLCEPARHFTRRSNLIAHQATHYREITKTYICNWPRCPWSFPRAADLHRHRRSVGVSPPKLRDCAYIDSTMADSSQILKFSMRILRRRLSTKGLLQEVSRLS